MKTLLSAPCVSWVLFFALLIGCASMNVQSEHDEAADFSTYKTWDWLPASPDAPADSFYVDAFADTRIRNAVEKTLREKGYEKSSESPDFLVNYHAALQDNLTVTQVSDTYRNNPYAEFDWTSTYTYEWQVGTLILDFFDARTKRLAWRASVQAEVRQTDNVEMKEDRVNKAVKEMLSKFPPK